MKLERAQRLRASRSKRGRKLLLEVLAEDRPDDLEPAAAAFAASGPGVTRKVLRGLRAAVKRRPDAAAGAALVRPLLEE